MIGVGNAILNHLIDILLRVRYNNTCKGDTYQDEGGTEVRELDAELAECRMERDERRVG